MEIRLDELVFFEIHKQKINLMRQHNIHVLMKVVEDGWKTLNENVNKINCMNLIIMTIIIIKNDYDDLIVKEQWKQ